MATKTQRNEIPIRAKVMDIARTLGYLGGDFSFKLSFGDTCFTLDTKGTLATQVPSPPVKKRISPSSKRRNKERKIAFLSRKKASSTPAFLPTAGVSEPSSPASGCDTHSSVTLGDEADPNADNINHQQEQENVGASSLCVCGSVPCVCLMSQSPINPVPKIKLKKTSGTWSSMHHCPNCSKALHDHHHQCGDDDGEDGDDISGPQLLDLSACEEISISKTLTAEQKYTALIDNCYKLIQVEPINHVVAKFCFSHARFYQLRKDDFTLGYSKEHLIKETFDPEYERLKSENGL